MVDRRQAGHAISDVMQELSEGFVMSFLFVVRVKEMRIEESDHGLLCWWWDEGAKAISILKQPSKDCATYQLLLSEEDKVTDDNDDLTDQSYPECPFL